MQILSKSIKVHYDTQKGGAYIMRRKINALLDKMTDNQLERVYRFAKYIYIHA